MFDMLIDQILIIVRVSSIEMNINFVSQVHAADESLIERVIRRKRTILIKVIIREENNCYVS